LSRRTVSVVFAGLASVVAMSETVAWAQRDRLNGRRGRDRLNSRDGFRDRVKCGPGRDRVRADRRDLIAANCEAVVRS
jgi:hypothetical protein